MTNMHPRTSPTTEQSPSASPHSYGHFAGLHGEDSPCQSEDCCSAPSCHVSTPPPPPAEKQGKLVLRMPQTPTPARREQRDETRQRLPQPQRLGHLATIGYCQPGAQAVLKALLSQEDFLLIDIRATPWSYYPEWQGTALAAQFTRQYLHFPELGNRNAHDAALPIQVQNPQEGLRHLLPLLDAGCSCVLLCGCRTWQTCHRAHVADLLQRARPALRVWHLSSLVTPAHAVEVQASSRGELGISLDLTLAHALRGEDEQEQQRQQQESILVTPLTLSVRVPGRGVTTRHLDFVSWPQGGRPGREPRRQPGAASPIPQRDIPRYPEKETPSWNR